jgi:hypothetical protein
MKAPLEVQRVHDVLECLLAEDPLGLDREERLYAGAAHDALAWALGLPCGRKFGTDFEKVLAQLKGIGIDFVDVGMVTTCNRLEGHAS